MNDGKLTIDLSGVGNDIPTKLGKSRPTLTLSPDRVVFHFHFPVSSCVTERLLVLLSAAG